MNVLTTTRFIAAALCPEADSYSPCAETAIIPESVLRQFRDGITRVISKKELTDDVLQRLYQSVDFAL